MFGLKFFFGRENVLAFAFLVALVTASFFSPVVALAACVIFAFLLPGWLLLKIMRLDLPLAVAFAVCVLSSVLVSTHAVYWVSLALGYSQASILAAFIALAFAVFLVPSREFSRASLSETRRKLEKEFASRSQKLVLACSALVFAVVFVVLSLSLWVPTPNGVIVGGWNYGDFFFHLGVIESVNQGNFPPQEPVFAGVPLVYHWFADLHTAFMAEISGVHASFFARFETAFYVSLLFAGVYYLASFFFDSASEPLKKKAKLAALLAAVLFVFGGGFGYLRLADDLNAGKAPFLELLKQSPYDNDWAFFQAPSLMTGYLLVQRPMAIGLPVLVFALLLVLSGAAERNSKKIFLAGLFCGLLANFQLFAFGALAFAATLWFALEFLQTKQSFGVVARDFAVFAAPAVVFGALPFFAALQRAGSAGLTTVKFFWTAPHDALGFASFYAANLGFVFVIAVAVIFASLLVGLVPQLKRFAPSFDGKAFLALFLAAVFVFVNVFGSQWDAAKFFVFALLACSVIAAAALVRLPKIVVVAAVLLSIVTPVLSLYWFPASQWVGASNEEIAAGEWIRANTPPLSVFLAFPAHNNPVAPIGGRLAVSGYGGWMATHGLPYVSREADLRSAYCGSAEDAARVAREYGARFIYFGAAERREYAGCAFAFASASSPLFSRVFDSGGIQVFELR